ncbi:Excinuclease ABC subunit C [Desulfacinum hydrothermale DSM 13146]|uniref:UvrABC system protein C n=1 Tax=Desulfacinum hydrothermale DSM 13146 TaxID=1121390 RepID=A0A1W1X9L2_9BACT|nr:excinuclease ABC subunit UvrC [Desulfacinum hydrothermale]SMC20510.1 Excinuclease ABC subunit C [Desulfacinum hydrothermale DSM 13146]
MKVKQEEEIESTRKEPRTLESEHRGEDDSPEQPLQVDLETFPHLPGVYLFKASTGQVLYVGKARDLRKRVASYFRPQHSLPLKTQALVRRASRLDFVVTRTEKEALLLESSLIKRHRPRYNVILRDDKNYPALKIDLREPFPRLQIVRRFQKDGALYFGPYHSAHSLRETLKVLNRIFPLRQCKSKKLLARKRPCLNYSLGRCLGACAGKVTEQEYRRMVDEVILFLRGKTDRLQKQIRKSMQEAAEALDFERAALYRDRLQAVEEMLEAQVVVSERMVDQDVLGLHLQNDSAHIAVLFVRHGAIVGQRDYSFRQVEEQPEELLETFLQQFYAEGRLIPREILVPSLPAGHQVLSEWLSDLSGRKVRIWAAQRGSRRALLDLAQRNAMERAKARTAAPEAAHALLTRLQARLHLPRIPHTIACVDISNLQGRHAVGSVVVFFKGQPRYADYRRFRIRTKTEPDDPAMMAETVERLLEKERALARRLDLLLLDGGKSQLNRILALLDEKGWREQLPVAAFAKERQKDLGQEGRGLYEKVYLPGRKDPLFLTRHPEVLHLLQRIRDEAHRYAISGYQRRHQKELLSSELDQIPGVGPKRRQTLLKHFGDVEAIRRAGLEELARVPGMPRRLAERIHGHFHGAGKAP